MTLATAGGSMAHLTAERRSWTWEITLVVLGAVGLVALVFFDLAPALAYSDDWVYAWDVRHLLQTHHLQLFPEQSSSNLVQIAAGAAFYVVWPDGRALRLTGVVFLMVALWAAWGLARELGAGRFWSLAAAVAVLGAPIYMGVSTSFLGEPVYVGLLMATLYLAVRWMRTSKGLGLAVVIAFLATMQRQHGALLLVVLAIAVWLASRRRRIGPSAVGAIATLAVLDGVVLALPSVLGLTTAMQAHRLGQLLHPSLADVLRPIGFLPGMIGLFLLPFGVSSALAPSVAQRAPRWLRTLLLTLTAGAVGLSGFLALHGWRIFPGYTFTNLGLNPVNIAHPWVKPEVFPFAFLLPLEVAAMSAAVVILVIRMDEWSAPSLGGPGLLVVLAGITQLIPMLNTGNADRYYLPTILPLIPLVASWGVRAARQNVARGACVAGIALGLGMYVVGQQDYAAWMLARDTAARLAYQRHSPGSVDAGYEAYGVYYVVPYVDAHGVLPRAITDSGALPSQDGPLVATVEIGLGQPGDARQGSPYRSVASGKAVVIEKR